MHDSSVLGISFGEWLLLTEEYSRELEALRRRELGASTKLQELAKRMQNCQEQVVATSAFPNGTCYSARKQDRPARRDGLWIRAVAWLFGENRVAA